jgi:hypothetical protein
MFLADLGYVDKAVSRLGALYECDSEGILPKWRYLWEKRADFRTRYAPLFGYLRDQGAL